MEGRKVRGLIKFRSKRPDFVGSTVSEIAAEKAAVVEKVSILQSYMQMPEG